MFNSPVRFLSFSRGQTRKYDTNLTCECDFLVAGVARLRDTISLGSNYELALNSGEPSYKLELGLNSGEPSCELV